VREIVEPLLDSSPPNPLEGKFREKRRTLSTINTLVRDLCGPHVLMGRLCFVAAGDTLRISLDCRYLHKAASLDRLGFAETLRTSDQ
jgi:hypothetical protein